MAKKTKYRDEDLFKDSTMTFGEHLEELRAALFKSLLCTILALVVVLIFGLATDAVIFIQKPLTDALKRFYGSQALRRAEKLLTELRTAKIPVPSADEAHDVVDRDDLVPQVSWLDERTQSDIMTQRGWEKRDFPGLIQADILGTQSFCGHVFADRELEGTPGHFIWGRFSTTGQALIEKGATKEFSSTPEDAQELADLKTALVAELNQRVLSVPNFHEETKSFFDAMTALRDRPKYSIGRLFDTLSGEYDEQTKRADRLDRIVKALGQAGQEELKKLNRQLLALAYPDAVPAGPRKANMMPVVLWHSIEDDPRLAPKSLNVQEMFMVWLKAAIVLSLVIASPFVFYFIWSFVAAGLYPHEKGYVFLYLPFSLGLFLAGCALCFFYVLKYVLDFLFMFNDWMNVDPDMRISEWFGFALFLPLGFGIAFQLPLVMLFMERIGIMTVSGYLAKWRISVMVICVVSAILTPADPYSMLLMAIPLVLLYFLGIGLCRYLPRRRSAFDEEATA
jgi:sec-independent protein translocase protein TatC